MLSPLTDQEKHRVSAEVSEATQIGKKLACAYFLLSPTMFKGKLPNLARTRLAHSGDATP